MSPETIKWQRFEGIRGEKNFPKFEGISYQAKVAGIRWLRQLAAARHQSEFVQCSFGSIGGENRQYKPHNG